AHIDYSVPFELNNTIWSTRRTKPLSSTVLAPAYLLSLLFCPLCMPDTFFQKHWDELLDTVKLIVPTDDYWCVDVNKNGKKAVEIVDPLNPEQGPKSSPKSFELPHGAKRRKIASGNIKLLHCYERRSRTNKLQEDGWLSNAKNLNILGNNNLTKPLRGKLVRQSMKTPIHSTVATGDTKNSFTVQQWEKFLVHRSSDNRRKRGQPRAAEANRATNAAKMFMPKNSYFMMTLEEYNVIQNYILVRDSHVK
ncbi:hypothetical protein HAX54_003035, partial [Datura stramonium]|nr:hypothetical protein [Datura stramonium]